MSHLQLPFDIDWPTNMDHVGDPARCAGWPTMRSASSSKRYVMEWARNLVSQGLADWDDLGSGQIELRLATGEIFILGRVDLTRIR